MRVNPVGPKDARIVIIGEAPGEQEEKHGIPFVGLSGKVLNHLLEDVGIKRDSCYITNVCKVRPPNNDMSKLPKEDLSLAKAELFEELSVLSPNVIVCLGEHALNTITGLKGIKNWRGSIINSNFGKVIPTFHPAAISREWKFRALSLVDWMKVRAESEFRDIRRKHRELIVNPKFDDVINYLDDIIKNKRKVAFDIEVETRQISCMSFSTAPVEAMCIPFWFGASGSIWSEERENAIWRKIKELLEDESVPKIAQNAQYDMTILRDKYGICVRGLWLDTMIAFHSVYPELPKSLATLTSLYTDVPYYKFQRMTKNMEEFFRYNALDACVTFECAEKIYEEMREFGVVDFYYEHMHSLIQPLLDISSIGVRIDIEKKKKLILKMRNEVDELQKKLNGLVGHDINVNSPKQMKSWLYDELKLKPKFKFRKGTKDRTVSADEEALLDLYKESGLPALKVVLEIRERQKLLSTYLEVEYDKEEGEERARTSYLITGTETGRLSSRETVYGTGTNLQNVPKNGIRHIFIPDDGCKFINCDLSQAEVRVVAWLSNEERLIRIFTEGGDIHRKNASNIFRKPIDEVNEEERYIAKRVVHASNYGIGPITLSKQAEISVAEAKRLLNAYFAEYPRIKLWQLSVASSLRKSRTMQTPLGRKRTFFNMWNESLLKEAYAYVPQSVVADILNAGLRKVYERYKGTDVKILLQIHDAILIQAPANMVDDVCVEVKKLLEIPIRIGYNDYVIPVDISVGDNWEDLKKVSV